MTPVDKARPQRFKNTATYHQSNGRFQPSEMNSALQLSLEMISSNKLY